MEVAGKGSKFKNIKCFFNICFFKVIVVYLKRTFCYLLFFIVKYRLGIYSNKNLDKVKYIIIEYIELKCLVLKF